MDELDYRNIVIRVLWELKINADDGLINGIVQRLMLINRMVAAANFGDKHKQLRSTQVICKIIYDYLVETDVEILYYQELNDTKNNNA